MSQINSGSSRGDFERVDASDMVVAARKELVVVVFLCKTRGPPCHGHFRKHITSDHKECICSFQIQYHKKNYKSPGTFSNSSRGFLYLTGKLTFNLIVSIAFNDGKCSNFGTE